MEIPIVTGPPPALGAAGAGTNEDIVTWARLAVSLRVRIAPATSGSAGTSRPRRASSASRLCVSAATFFSWASWARRSSPCFRAEASFPCTSVRWRPCGARKTMFHP